MNMTDLEMDLLLAQAEVATLKRAAAGNMFTVPDDFVKVVRCEHCEYQDDCMKQIVFCERDHVLEQNVNQYHKLEFCSFGKRKDGDNHG